MAHWQIHLSARGLIQSTNPGVANNTNNFIYCIVLHTCDYPLPERILVGKKLPRKRLVDDDDVWALLIIVLIEIASLHERYLHRCEVVVADRMIYCELPVSER